MAIAVKLDDLLHDRRMTLTELADRVGMTLANLSILKTGKARAIRFSTLDAICEALSCQPGDILKFESEHAQRGEPAMAGKGSRKPMRHHVIVTTTSLLSILFAAFHIADDIVRGIEPGQMWTLSAVMILVTWLYGTLMLANRHRGMSSCSSGRCWVRSCRWRT